MCGVVGTVASVVMAAVGTAVSAAGAAKQADYQSAMARRNARLAKEQAADAIKRGREEESRLRYGIFSAAGEAQARLAASGAYGETSSSLLEDIYFIGELDAAAIRRNTEREAWAYNAQAAGYRAQAGMYQSAGGYGVATSLLSGATSIGDTLYQYNRDYVPPQERTRG